MNGIDVSYAQGRIDWPGVSAEGIDFAMVKASQGRLLSDPDSGPFADPRFRENVEGAAAAGLSVGVYHYLCAGTAEEAAAEAEFFLSVLAPYRSKITLWAVCDAEEDRYLSRDRETLGAVVDAFLGQVGAAGYRPMLYSNPNYLTYRLPDMRRWDLWLAYWGASEARALAYNPKIWQYGTDAVANLRIVDVNRGYFSLEDEAVFEDHPRDDDGVLVSGGDSRVDSGVPRDDVGRIRCPRLGSPLYRRPDERRGGILHDQIRRREQRENPAVRLRRERR